MSYKRILVAIDDSPISYAAVEHALALAKLSQAQVTLLSVVADPFIGVDFYQVAPAITEHFLQAEAHAKSRLDEIKQSFLDAQVSVDTKLYHSVPPAEGILNTASDIDADLIIMGSHGHTGVKKFVLGSVAQHVLADAHLPVLIIKH
jgi:nucleotide-binding universal stress UspA family protein